MPQHLKLNLVSSLLLILLVINFTKCSPTIIMNYNKTYNITMYENYERNTNFFIPSGFNCYNYDLFTNNLTQSLYNISIFNMTQEYNITFTTITNDVLPIVQSQNCANSSNCTLQIVNHCRNQDAYDAITITISSFTNIELTYNVICNPDIVLSPFQYGLIVLVVLTAIQIIVCSKFQQANSFKNWGHYINLYTLGAYCGAIVLGQILILLQIQTTLVVASYICLVFSMIVSILCTMVCLCQYLYYTRIKVFRTIIYWRLRVMDLMGLIIGLVLVLAWYLGNKNWILSDILYVIIFLTIIKLIKFDSLKMAFISYMCAATLNVIFICVSQYAFQYYFNNVILTIFNNPFFILCPCINFIPNQKCSWFFITSMVYPAIVLCYLKRFDYNNSTQLYSIVFISVFIVFSGVWLVISKFTPVIIPFDLINIPVCMFALCMFANRRGQLHNLWDGQIYDQQHKNKNQQQKQLNNILGQQRRNSYKSQWFRLSFSSRISSYSGPSQSIKSSRVPLEPTEKKQKKQNKSSKISKNNSLNKSQTQRQSQLQSQINQK